MRRLVDIRPDDSLLDVAFEIMALLLFTTITACLVVGIWALIIYGVWSTLT